MRRIQMALQLLACTGIIMTGVTDSAAGGSSRAADTAATQTLPTTTRPTPTTIDAKVSLIERAITTQQVQQERWTPRKCASYVAPERTIYRRGKHVIKLLVEMGSDDSMLTMHHYYHQGQLILIHIVGGAMNDTRQLWKRYYDGPHIIHEVDTLQEGPGYPFGDVFAYAPNARDPEAFFRNRAECR